MPTTLATIHQPNWREAQPDLERRLLADRVLIASDFDGTLAPIADTPKEAVILPQARATLDRLSKLPGTITAVVSGRAISDVAERVDLPQLFYAGNHGTEMQGPGMPPLVLFSDEARPELESSLQLLHERLDEMPGILIEDKGVTASVHYRNVACEDYDHVAEAVIAACDLSPHLKLKHGKMVWELRPDLAWNKGSAVIRFMARFKIPAWAAFFLGDDESDDDAFRVLPRGLRFIVGERRTQDADYRCEDPADAADLLTWIHETRRRLKAN